MHLVSVLLAFLAGDPTDDGRYLSISSTGIYRFDPQTQQATQLATGLPFPLYSYVLDDKLMVPEAWTGSIVSIDLATGIKTVTTIQNNLAFPAGFVMDEPVQRCFVAELTNNLVVEVFPTGAQVIRADNASGLFNAPAGIAVDQAGVIYIGNFGDGKILALDPGSPTPRVLTDGAGLTTSIAGLDVDQAGNLFAVDFVNDIVLRVRTDTGACELFCQDSRFRNLRDIVVLEREGKMLLTSSDNQSLFELDIFGKARLLFQDPTLDGAWQGISVPSDTPRCLGQLIPYGTGSAPAGSNSPRMQGMLSACLGASFGLEILDLPPGSGGYLLGSTSLANASWQGWSLVMELPLPRATWQGGGPDPSRLVLSLEVPDDPQLLGTSMFFQTIVENPDGIPGYAVSNGLEARFGE